jgi:hypothetical protein
MEQYEIKFTADSVRSQFVILAVFWWLGYLASIVGYFIKSLGLLSLPLMIVTTIFWCILLYRHWLVLQGHGARTTPGKAVGFGFIPLFNFYWWYIAYVGLAEDNNKYISEEGIGSVRMSYNFALVDYILTVIACTLGLVRPSISVVILVPSMIIGYILICQQRDCILAILAHNTGQLTERQ